MPSSLHVATDLKDSGVVCGVVFASGQELVQWGLYPGGACNTTRDDGGPAMQLTGEYGILFVDTTNLGRSGTNTGGPGIFTINGTAVVTGFTAYRNVGSSATCPTPIRR